MARGWRRFPWKPGMALLLMVGLGLWYAGAARKSVAPDVRREVSARAASDDSSVAGGQQSAVLEARPEVGYPAPDFLLRDLEGRSVRLSDFRGKKAVFLNFWATWCTPCRTEMPTMEQAYRGYRAKGLEILAVSIDTGPKETVQAFMKELNLTFPALLDPGMEISGMYRVLGIPGSFLIDRQGVVRHVEIGFRDWTSPESREKLEKLLE